MHTYMHVKINYSKTTINRNNYYVVLVFSFTGVFNKNIIFKKELTEVPGSFVINVHPGEILFTSRSPLHNKALLFRLKFPKERSGPKPQLKK